MDNNLKEQLLKEWKEANEKLKNMSLINNESGYKILSDRVKHLESLLTDLEKSEMDISNKIVTLKSEEQYKKKQMEEDKKNQFVRIGADVAKVALQLGVAVGFGYFATKWEKLDTMTSTAGKRSWSDIMKFKF